MTRLNELNPLFSEVDLSLEEDFTQIDVFYTQFETDFITTPFELNGKKIKIFTEKSKIQKFKNYSETFVHIITREVKTINQRFYEPHRANRIHWIKPILLNVNSKKIFFFKWNDGKGVCKYHYWYYEKDFMVVLKEVNPELMIVTAFCVDKDEKLNYYERYINYKEGNGNC